MFKKLKDKIAEEVKASPQRVTQLAKSVVGGSNPDESNTSNANMFSIDEESAVNFNTSTPTPSYNRTRRDSGSSFASDVSFLPSYESPGNLYHLQSDLDVSASEVEDSATSHADRNQILGAYRNAMAKYNKYRGRYSDLANHYRVLERENAKTKSVLVETQDKALRRVAELKEQCTLEQNAKAHMEQVLREDLNEKQILIDTLNTKVKLLQTPDNYTGSTAQLADLANLQSLKEHLEDELSATRADHTRELEALRHATRQKVIDLETRMQDSRTALEDQLLEKEAELMQLRYSGEATSLQRDLQDKLQALETLQAENKVLQSKTFALSSLEAQNKALQGRIAALTGVELDNEALRAKVTALADLQGANTALERQVSELTPVHTENQTLRAQIREFTALELDYKQLQAKISDISVLQAENAKLQAKLSDLAAENDVQATARAADHQRNVSELKRSALTINELVAEVSALKIVKHTFESEREELKQALNARILELADLQAENQAFSGQIIKIDVLNGEIRRLTDDLVQKESENVKLNELSRELDGFKESLAHKSTELTRQQETVARQAAELEEWSAKAAECDGLEEGFRKQSQELKEERENLKETLANKSRELADKCEELTRAEERVQLQDARFTKATEESTERFAELQQQLAIKDQQIERLTQEMEDTADECSHLKDRFQAEQEESTMKCANLQAEVAGLQQELVICAERTKADAEDDEIFSDNVRKLTNSLDNAVNTDVDFNSKRDVLKLVQQLLDNRADELKDLQDELRQKDERIASLADGQEHAKTMTRAAEDEHSQLQRKYEALQRQAEENEDRMRQATQEYEGLQHALEHKQRAESDVHKEMHDLKQKMAENQSEADKCIESERTQVLMLREQLQEVERTMQKTIDECVRAQVDDLNGREEKLKQKYGLKLKEMQKLSADLQMQLKQLDEQNATVRSELETAKMNLETASADKESLSVERQTLEAQLEELKQQVSAGNEEIPGLKSQLAESKERQATIAVENEELRRQIAQAHERVQQELENMQDTQRKMSELVQKEQETVTAADRRQDELSREIGELHRSLTDHQEVAGRLKSEQETLICRNTDLANENTDLKSLKTHLEADLNSQNADLTAQNADLLARTASLIAQTDRLTVENTRITAENTSSPPNPPGTFRSQITSLEHELSQKQHDLTSLAVDRDSLITELNTLEADTMKDSKSEATLRSKLEEQLTELQSRNTELLDLLEARERELARFQAAGDRLVTGGSAKQTSTAASTQTHDDTATSTPARAHTQRDKATATRNNTSTALHNLEDELQRVAADRETSIQFYQEEMARLQRTNTKLETQLDETLVTLNHCTELAEATTEMQYLRNILYNYMMGKESIVLARVIAAVCKFEPHQTDAVLAKEQQKQTLFGQLGIL